MNKAIVLGFMVLVLGGCGQGNEPLSTLGGNPGNTGNIGLNLPITQTLTAFGPFSPSTSPISDGFDLTGTFSGLSIPVKAPGSGLVVANDVATYSVTIQVTGYLSVKITGITSIVQPGNYVIANAQIGTVANTYNTVRLSVYYNGTAVCPLSYLSASARSAFQTAVYSVYSSNPCRQ